MPEKNALTPITSGDDPHRYRKHAPRAPEGKISSALIWPMLGHLSQTHRFELEIGFGLGRFLVERAYATRDTFTYLLGVEIRSKLAYQVSQKVRAQDLQNRVTVWAGDIREIVKRMDETVAFDRCYVHFPDPWWKKRHLKRTVVSSTFLDDLIKLLRADGELFIQTDVEERAQRMAADIEAHTGFDLKQPPSTEWDPNYGARSNREARAIADGVPVWRMLASRKHDSRHSTGP